MYTCTQVGRYTFESSSTNIICCMSFRWIAPHTTHSREIRAHNSELCSEHFDMFSFLLHTHCHHKFKIEIGGAYWHSTYRDHMHAQRAAFKFVYVYECCCVMCCTFRALVVMWSYQRGY